MRINETIDTLIEKLETDHYVFSYFFKKEMKKNLQYSFKDYFDVGFQQLEQITKEVQKNIRITPSASSFSWCYIVILLKSIFNKKSQKQKVITKRGFTNYNHFYNIVHEAINHSDLSKVVKNTNKTSTIPSSIL